MRIDWQPDTGKPDRVLRIGKVTIDERPWLQRLIGPAPHRSDMDILREVRTHCPAIGSDYDGLLPRDGYRLTRISLAGEADNTCNVSLIYEPEPKPFPCDI